MGWSVAFHKGAIFGRVFMFCFNYSLFVFHSTTTHTATTPLPHKYLSQEKWCSTAWNFEIGRRKQTEKEIVLFEKNALPTCVVFKNHFLLHFALCTPLGRVCRILLASREPCRKLMPNRQGFLAAEGAPSLRSFQALRKSKLKFPRFDYFQHSNFLKNLFAVY